MTGPIFVDDARPGDMLEVRYLRMTPRLRHGSNLAANWGYLYREFGERERVTIYELDEKRADGARALRLRLSRDVPGSRHDHALPGLRPAGDAARRARARAAASGDRRCRTRHRRAHQHDPARPARRQHRQLAHRRGCDDVLSRPGRRRAVLGGRSTYQPGRWRDLGHGRSRRRSTCSCRSCCGGTSGSARRCWRARATGSFMASTRT